jgi:DNA-binding NtrC family response regulator
MTVARLLVIEDDPAMADLILPMLERRGFEIVHVDRGDRGLARAQAERFDAVLTDVWLPGIDGLELTRRLRAEQARLPVIVMTAHGTTDTAIEAMKLGAFDYILKPFSEAEVLTVLHSAIDAGRRMNEPVVLGPEVPEGSAMIGRSRPMQAVYKEIGRLAARPVSVLIRGETGTGKELVARAIYQHSERAKEPFVPVDCAAIPETLLESSLFGHERGAFTGADMRRIGRFEQANGGTLFLDEIGDLAPGTQVKLLRFLQERTFTRVGGQDVIHADVRVLAATHRDLESLMVRGEFREDLYYRLAVAVIQLPALRERSEDIPELVTYFGRRHGPDLGTPAPTFMPDSLSRLATHAWPGNVRELENVVRKTILRAQGYPVTVAHVEGVLSASATVAVPARTSRTLQEIATDLLARAESGEIEDARLRILAEAEAELIRQAIERCEGNQAKAARLLGMSRLTLREKLRTLGWHRDTSGAEG